MRSRTRACLAAGGHGFMLGDEQLRYAPNLAAEAFYTFILPAQHVTISPDFPFVVNPGYNRASSPVHVLAARLHVDI